MLASLSELRSYAAGDLIVEEGDCDSVEHLSEMGVGLDVIDGNPWF